MHLRDNLRLHLWISDVSLGHLQSIHLLLKRMNDRIEFIDDGVFPFLSLSCDLIHLFDISVQSRDLKVSFPQHCSLALTLLSKFCGFFLKLYSQLPLFSKGGCCKLQSLFKLSYLFDEAKIFGF